MLDELFKRSIMMVKEEKGIWYKIYRLLLQFREEASSRVFKFLRGATTTFSSIERSLNSLFESKKNEIKDLLKSQIRFAAESEGSFWKGSLETPLKNFPRKLNSVKDAPLYSGKGNLFSRIFDPVRKKLKQTLQFSISQNHSIDQTLDRVFGKDTPKEIKVQTWRGKEFQGGVLAKVRKSLQSLVTTAYYEMVGKVRKFAYKRTDRIEVLRSVAVLDSRTTKVCRDYDGLRFRKKDLTPVGHNQKFIDVPRHWNCRSQYIPEDFDGKDLPKKDFTDWFKELGKSAQDSLLGIRGGELYRGNPSGLPSILKRLSPSYLG